MLAWHGFSGFACLVRLLQNKVTKTYITFPSVYCEFPNPFPSSSYSYQFWSYIALESRVCSVFAQRWLQLSGTSVVPCCTLELLSSWFKMSFICSGNGSADDLISAPVLWMPPTSCFLNTEGDTVPSKSKRWGASMSKKNYLGAERHVLVVKVDVCGFAPFFFSVKSIFHPPTSFSHISTYRSFSNFQVFLPSSSLLAPAGPHVQKSFFLLKDIGEQMTQQLLANVMEEIHNHKVFLGARRSSESFHHLICGKHYRSQDRRHLWLQDWSHWWKRVSQQWIMITEAAEIKQFPRG